MDILSLCVCAILSIVLVLIIYRAWNPSSISRKKLDFSEYKIIRNLGDYQLKKIIMEHFESIGILKDMRDKNLKLDIFITKINNRDVDLYIEIYDNKTNGTKKEKLKIPFYTNDNDCFVDLNSKKFGCIKLDSF